MSVNSVNLLGNIGSDVELRKTPSGQSVCNFRLATNRKVKDKQHTDWHNIVVWGKQADNCHKFLEKGRQVFIDGTIQYRDYENKQGNKVYITEIVAKNVQFVGKAESKQPANNSNTAKIELDGEAFNLGDMPF